MTSDPRLGEVRVKASEVRQLVFGRFRWPVEASRQGPAPLFPAPSGSGSPSRPWDMDVHVCTSNISAYIHCLSAIRPVLRACRAAHALTRTCRRSGASLPTGDGDHTTRRADIRSRHQHPNAASPRMPQTRRYSCRQRHGSGLAVQATGTV